MSDKSKTFLSIGSGPGIGLATAERFARERCRVVLTSRNQQRLLQRAEPLRAKGCAVEVETVDANVAPGSAEASAIADKFWELYSQDAGAWTTEVSYRAPAR